MIPSTLFFLRRLLAYHTPAQLFSGLMWILFHAWPILPGLLAKAFFDALTGQRPAGLTPESIVALVVALALARAGFVYLDVLVSARLFFRAKLLLQRNLLARILERPGAQALPGSVGEALTTFRDDTETMFNAGWTFDVVGFTLFAVGGLMVLLWVDARVTLLVFLPTAALIVFAYAARTRLRRVREESREATARVTGALGELFDAVQAVQVAAAEDRVVARLRRLGEERRRMVLRDRLAALVLDATFENTANLGAGLTLLFAASALRSGRFTVGDLALFSTYLMQLAGMTGFLGWMVATYQHMGVAFRRGLDLMQGAPAERLVEHHPIVFERPPRPVAPTERTVSDRLERLDVVGLSCRGVRDVSFSLRRGSLTAVTGRIGSGKTTLLRAVLGLLPAEGGELRWNGRRVTDPGAFMLPPRVGYTPQAPTLLSGPLRESVLLGVPERDSVLDRALRTAVLERDLAAFPAGLDTEIGARGLRLSGGQQQRAAAARMLVREPELYVVDDPSSALDVEAEELLWRRLLALGGTYLVATHRREVLARADLILLLADGRVAASGTFELLRANADFAAWDPPTPSTGSR